jgi:hypothetical protein
MGWGMAVVEYCEVGVPFIGPGRRGGGRPVVMVTVVRFQLAAGYGGEAKRRRHRLREGKGGGDREASGPVRRGWPEGMEGGTLAFGRETAAGAAARGSRRRRRLLVLYVF